MIVVIRIVCGLVFMFVVMDKFIGINSVVVVVLDIKLVIIMDKVKMVISNMNGEEFCFSMLII